MAKGNPQTGQLRERRQALGLSQEGLARLADCSTVYVQTIERGYSPEPEGSPVYRRILRTLDETEKNGRPASNPDVRDDRLGRSRPNAG